MVDNGTLNCSNNGFSANLTNQTSYPAFDDFEKNEFTRDVYA